ADDTVADRELGDVRPEGFRLAGELAAGDRVRRPEEAGRAHERPDDAGQVRLATTPAAVAPVDARRVHLDEDLLVGRHGPLDLLEPQNLRWPVLVVHDRSHRARPPSTVRTTFPVFCCVSTYLVAST